MEPRAEQIKLFRAKFRKLVDNLYLHHIIDARTLNAYRYVIRYEEGEIHRLARGLYGRQKEAELGRGMSLAFLSLYDLNGRSFNQLVLKESNPPRRRSIQCLVGHRFTDVITRTFRWNVRQLFELFQITPDYSGFSGEAIEILPDLDRAIRSKDFCLLDNRATTNPSKPNVYMEAAMAYALKRPFIFCHYKSEQWPSDFSNVFNVRYRNYEELFGDLYLKLPGFLRACVLKKRRVE